MATSEGSYRATRAPEQGMRLPPERAAIIRRLADTYADLARRAEYGRDVARK